MVFHNWSLREDGMYFPFLLETGHSSEKSYTGRKSTSESTHNSYEQIQLSRQRGLHSWKCPEPKKLSGDSLLHISKTPCALLLQTLQVLAKRCKFKIGMDCLEWQNSYKGGFFFFIPVLGIYLFAMLRSRRVVPGSFNSCWYPNSLSVLSQYRRENQVSLI